MPAPHRYRWLLPGAIGMCLGAGLAILVLYCVGGERSFPTFSSFQTAGPLPTAAPPDDPDAEKKSDAARQVAEVVLEAITKRDAATIAAMSDTPFLGGAMHNQRLIRTPAELTNALKDDLCQGPYAPYMFERKWDIAGVLTPFEFSERYSDYLFGSPDTRKLLTALGLRPGDRLVVENERGMVILVRSGGDRARVIGILAAGFKPRPFRLTRDVVYGRKYGTALTLDLLQPLRKGNQAAVLELVSDTFASGSPIIGGGLTIRTQGLLDAGFTVILVTHSSAPKHTIPEILGDIHRAVRFVRYHAKRLDLDPDRIAVMGGSSGGYLALMVGESNGEGPAFPPDPDPVRMTHRDDPVEAVSSRVQAVISYFPPTDWLNYGQAGITVFDLPFWRQYQGVFDLYEFDAGRTTFNKITDRARILHEMKDLSPAERAGRQAAPTLLFHGDKDTHVPRQQSQRMVDALQKAGVPVELVTKPGVGHGWADNAEDTAKIIAWLNRYLLNKE
jgi:acetyl esterase/lipase